MASCSSQFFPFPVVTILSLDLCPWQENSKPTSPLAQKGERKEWKEKKTPKTNNNKQWQQSEEESKLSLFIIVTTYKLIGIEANESNKWESVQKPKAQSQGRGKEGQSCDCQFYLSHQLENGIMKSSEICSSLFYFVNATGAVALTL